MVCYLVKFILVNFFCFKFEYLYFLFSANFYVGYISSENLARDKISFQSSIALYGIDKISKFSVDSNIDLYNCSLTSKAKNHYSWLAVDLGNVYQVNKVCLLNSISGKNLFFVLDLLLYLTKQTFIFKVVN